ncbi:MAG TPA: VTT domain-containing protein [Thermoanaerobaculia bacterium]|nr:VTT domain-containing protein [Thermoanaerobaculia bacterium]
MRVAKVLIALLAAAALVIAWRILPLGPWIQQFTSYVRSAGPAGYLLYIVAYIVCCVFVVPALALTLAAGAIFGVTTGVVIVLIGATAGATAAFFLGRTIFRRYVEARIASNPKMAAVDRAIAREGTKIMLLMRLSGFPPFTWINYALGVTGVSFKAYLWTTFFGIIPGTIAFTYAGAAGAKALTGKGNRITLIVTALGAVLVITYIARIAAQAIRRAGID